MGWKPELRSKLKIAHDKIMINGRNTLITGSFNFTKTTEESNAENLLILKPLRAEYIQDVEAHKGHSVGYAGR